MWKQLHFWNWKSYNLENKGYLGPKVVTDGVAWNQHRRQWMYDLELQKYSDVGTWTSKCRRNMGYVFPKSLTNYTYLRDCFFYNEKRLKVCSLKMLQSEGKFYSCCFLRVSERNSPIIFHTSSQSCIGLSKFICAHSFQSVFYVLFY